MRLRVLLLALASVCLLTGPALAADHGAAPLQKISLAAGGPRLEIVQQDQDQLRFHVEVGELDALEIATKQGTFTRLLIPGFHSSQQVGAPELPQMNRLVSIPLGARVRVEVKALSVREIDLADYGITSPLMPAQASMPKNADPATWPFAYDRSAYQVDRVSRELAQVVPAGRLRAMELGRLEIAPVEYLPAQNRLRVTESLDVQVSFLGADKAAAAGLIARTYSPFFEHLYANVAGAKSFHDSYPDRVADVVTMVIVTPPEFAAQLQDFVDWKTERGFRMIVAVTGTPEVGSTTSTIQSYLHGLYEDATPEEPAPSFVLFVGDVAQMPTFTLSGDASDRPYCAVDADLVPDMYYGRFSATNSSQLQAMIDKTMMYDQYTMPDPSYLRDVCMIAGVDSYYAPTYANGQINYGTTYYFNASHGLTSHTYLYPASGSSDAQIVQDVSNGVSYVNYTAHGSTTSWSDPTFTQANINSLQNAGKYCLAVGNCCLTSSYDIGECFAETWLRAANKGAIGYIGGSNSTYWDEDYWWGVGYTSSITANPTYEGSEMGAYDGLFHEHGEAEHLWYVTNDALIFCGNLAVMESGSSRTTYYWNIYNLMGDPSLSTYLGLPAANPVGISALSSASITVSADPGSYVGLTQNGVLVGAGTVGIGGSEVIPFTTTPTAGLPVHMVVTAQNHEPYVMDIALANPELWLSANSVTTALAAGETTVETLEIANQGEAGSILTFSCAVQAETPSAKGVKSIAGSTFTCDQSEYLSGSTTDLVFTVHNASTDAEWLMDISIDFPPGVTVNSSTAFTGGTDPMPSNGQTGDGAMVTWHGETTSGWGVIHGGETATATVNVTYAGSLSGAVDLDYVMTGDIYGSTPHTLSGTIVLTSAGPSLTLTAPDGGEDLGIDDPFTFTWMAAGPPLTDVQLELSRDAGGSWETLTASTPNDGAWEWIVTGPSSTECLARVRSLDGTIGDQSNGTFRIYQPVRWLAVVPASGELAQGESQTLEFHLDATGLSAGIYLAYVVITHNAEGSPDVIPVTLTITSDLSAAGDVAPVFRLAGNRPNPFNPRTEIAFSLDVAGPATVEVLDLRGRRVRTLWSGLLAAGDHHLAWDGLDEQGRAVASGVYLARLSTGDRKATHKMLLAR